MSFEEDISRLTTQAGAGIQDNFSAFRTQAFGAPTDQGQGPREFAMGGHGDPNAGVITAQVPGAEPVPYSAAIAPLPGEESYNDSVRHGADALKQRLNDAHTQDPNRELLVHSYSEGSAAAELAFMELHNEGSIPDDKLALNSYGSPSVPGGAGDWLKNQLPGLDIIGATPQTIPIDAFGGQNVHRIIKSGDSVSQNTGDLIGNILGYQTNHFSYDQRMAENSGKILPQGEEII